MHPAHVILLSLGLFVAGCTGVPPASLGIRDGRLAPCPPSPNCVSSGSPDKEHYTEPLRFTSAGPQVRERLRTLVGSMTRARLIEERAEYLHVEFTSLIFRFVDDVEFLINDRTKTIDIRSASRLGHSDLGVNLKRVEEIRTRWSALNP